MGFMHWSKEHTDLSLQLANILFEVSFCYKYSWFLCIVIELLYLTSLLDIYIFMKVFRIMKFGIVISKLRFIILHDSTE